MDNTDTIMRTVEVQATVIDLLSGAVDELFTELMQHITVEEAELHRPCHDAAGGAAPE